MLIAFDGGAFQQGVAAGIFNVAKGFLNTAARLDRSFEFILVGDPRLGPMRPELIDQLAVKPDVFFAEIGAAYATQRKALTTDDPAICFIVDGVVIPPRDHCDGWISYEGPTPSHSFIVASRTTQPSEIGINEDGRGLGI